MPLSLALLHSLHAKCVTEQEKDTIVRAAGCPPHVYFCGKVMRGRRCNDSYKLIAAAQVLQRVPQRHSHGAAPLCCVAACCSGGGRLLPSGQRSRQALF